MSQNKIFKPRPISGFPEWTPEVRLIEQQWFDHIRQVYESYGFCNIETPSVEEIEVISAKGEVDKEIYAIDRLNKDEAEDDADSRLALHFDLTVPLARYVAQHFNELVFPFKRYQMQRVWRGERPQSGRFREFYQCDIDVINVEHLPLHFDAEMPAIIWEILKGLPGMENESIQLRINNRKILSGFLENIGITDTHKITLIMRELDKLDKIGSGRVIQEILDILDCYDENGKLQDNHGMLEGIQSFIKTAETHHSDPDDLEDVLISNSNIDTANTTLRAGIDELKFVLDQLSHLPDGAVVADLSIVRGLDYYTGTVYETVFTDDPGYGSICSGGRYDDLASQYINKSLPGVGISIGFSRLFTRQLDQGKLPVHARSPANILMVLPNEEQRATANATAQTLRRRGFRVELYHAPQKLKKQLAYAEKKGIPYVWFPPFEAGQAHEVKNMATGEQGGADPNNWGAER